MELTRVLGADHGVASPTADASSSPQLHLLPFTGRPLHASARNMAPLPEKRHRAQTDLESDDYDSSDAGPSNRRDSVSWQRA